MYINDINVGIITPSLRPDQIDVTLYGFFSSENIKQVGDIYFTSIKTILFYVFIYRKTHRGGAIVSFGIIWKQEWEVHH